MKDWMTWGEKVGSNMKEMGAPLTKSQSIAVGGKTADSNREVSGYSIIEAENMEEARQMMASNPHLNGWSPNATIEIHEAVDMPAM